MRQKLSLQLFFRQIGGVQVLQLFDALLWSSMSEDQNVSDQAA